MQRKYIFHSKPWWFWKLLPTSPSTQFSPAWNLVYNHRLSFELPWGQWLEYTMVATGGPHDWLCSQALSCSPWATASDELWEIPRKLLRHPHLLASIAPGIWSVWMALGILQQALELERARWFDYHHISQSLNIFDPLQFTRHCAWHSKV